MYACTASNIWVLILSPWSGLPYSNRSRSKIWSQSKIFCIVWQNTSLKFVYFEHVKNNGEHLQQNQYSVQALVYLINIGPAIKLLALFLNWQCIILYFLFPKWKKCVTFFTNMRIQKTLEWRYFRSISNIVRWKTFCKAEDWLNLHIKLRFCRWVRPLSDRCRSIHGWSLMTRTWHPMLRTLVDSQPDIETIC